MQIEGQAAIVTGGASGMGAATARRLAAAGARVALFDRDGAGVTATATEMGGVGIECDITDARAVSEAIGRAQRAQGPVRICVNCAGILAARRLVGREGPMPLEDFEAIIRVNVIGTFNVLRLVAAEMRALEPITEEGERGVIVNTASIAAFDGQIGQTAYSASKGAVVAMTLPAARELAAFGIRVMTIAPGLVDTPLLGGMPAEVRQRLAEQIPFPSRFARPSEYAQLVAHIVQNPMLNGEVVRLDGAMRMPPR